jgi:peptidoglycan/LPS O-acetylase OafA/YrhL
MSNVPDGRRIYGLDVFRATAVLLVLIGHCLEHSKVSVYIQVFGRLGILGVELFFVLSGFLIGSIVIRLIESNKLHTFFDIFRFWNRRWLRTLPLYFVVLLAFLRFDYHGRHSLTDYPTYFLFMQNFITRLPEFFELSWSLAVEEHFYFWFPLVFVGWHRIVKNVRFSLPLTAVSFVCVVLSYRLLAPLFTDWELYNRSIRLMVLARLDAIMYGVLTAAAQYYWKAGFDFIRRATPLSAIAFVLLCLWWLLDAPGLMQSKFLQTFIFTFQAIICALLLPWFISYEPLRGQNAFILLTSKLSYSLYLTHVLVIIAINTALSKLGLYEAAYNNPFVIYPTYFSFFYFLAFITYRFIEKPFINLRETSFDTGSVAKAAGATIVICVVLIGFF